MSQTRRGKKRKNKKNRKIHIRVGHICSRVPKRRQTLSHNGNRKPFKWTLYAQVVEFEYFEAISRVEFCLHPTFEPSSFTKYEPPFQTTQTSYGFFDATVKVWLYDGNFYEFKHTLDIEDAEQVYELPLKYIPPQTSPESLPVPDDLTFGVEFELTTSGATQLEHVAALLRQQGVDCRFDGYSHAVTPYWKVVPDSSIQPPAGSSADHITFELVSPILRGNDGIKEMVRTIRAVSRVLPGGVGVNRSAGFHVHIGSAGLSLPALRHVCMTWLKFETAIDLIMPPSRRGDSNRYCHSNVERYGSAKAAMRAVASCGSLYQLQRAMNGANGGSGDRSARYHKLNLQRLQQPSPTLEFRQHSGTYHARKAECWVRLLLLLVHTTASRRQAPKSFREGRSAEHNLARLFEWVVKDRQLQRFFLGRYRELKQGRARESAAAAGGVGKHYYGGGGGNSVGGGSSESGRSSNFGPGSAWAAAGGGGGGVSVAGSGTVSAASVRQLMLQRQLGRQQQQLQLQQQQQQLQQQQQQRQQQQPRVAWNSGDGDGVEYYYA